MLPHSSALQTYRQAILRSMNYAYRLQDAKRQEWETELSQRIETAANNGESYITLTKHEHAEVQKYVNPVSLQGYTIKAHHAWLEPTTYRMYWSYHELPVQLSWSDRLLLWWVGLREQSHKNQPPF